VSIVDGTANVIFAGQAFIRTTHYTAQSGGGYLGSIFLGGTIATARCSTGMGPVDTDVDVLSHPGNWAAFGRDNAHGSDLATDAWGGPFDKGGLFVMCDATVRLFPYSYATSQGNTRLHLFLDPDDGVPPSVCGGGK
jgi:hypothetical protein